MPSSSVPPRPCHPQWIAGSPLEVLEGAGHGLQGGREPQKQQALGPRRQDERGVSVSGSSMKIATHSTLN